MFLITIGICSQDLCNDRLGHCSCAPEDARLSSSCANLQCLNGEGRVCHLCMAEDTSCHPNQKIALVSADVDKAAGIMDPCTCAMPHAGECLMRLCFGAHEHEDLTVSLGSWALVNYIPTLHVSCVCAAVEEALFTK